MASSRSALRLLLLVFASKSDKTISSAYRSQASKLPTFELFRRKSVRNAAIKLEPVLSKYLANANASSPKV